MQNSPEGWTIEHGALQSEGLLLLADSIIYDPKTGQLVAEGNIRLEGQGIRLRCERLEMDWKNRSGEAWALELEIEPDWTIRSRHVVFVGLHNWDFQAVEVSSCPQENPGWSMSLSRLKLDLNRFASFRNARLFVGSMPVLYLPWATYPAKTKRSSGLLPTLPRYSSVMGVTLGLPYFQALGDRMDLTLYPEFHTRENPLWGGEFRWNPEPIHAGSIQGQYIQQKIDGEHRYRFQIKDLWQREDGWQLSADINQASDNLMEADFGRSIGNLGNQPFDSAVYLGKNFPLASLSFHASERRSFFQAKEDPFYASGFPSSLRKQTLPEIQSRMYPIEVGRFYVDAGVRGSQLIHQLEFEDERPTKTYAWHRGDLFGRIQGRLGQWGPFRADLQALGRFTHYSASLSLPLYNTSSNASGSALSPAFNPFVVDGDPLNRSLGSGRLQLSGPPLGRTFERFRLLGYKGDLKHVLEPFIGYTQTSRTGLEGYVPRYDDIDSRPGVAGSAMGERSIELGLMQHFLGRPGQGYTFSDLVRWKVSAKYHFNPILLADGRFKKGWTSIDSDFDAEPSKQLRVSFRSSADMQENSLDNSLSVDVNAASGSRFNLAVFSTTINRFLLRQRGIQIGGLQRILEDRIRLEFQVNHNYHQLVSAQVGLAYMTPCVATSVRFSHIALASKSGLSRENRYDFVLSLRTLGDFPLFSR